MKEAREAGEAGLKGQDPKEERASQEVPEAQADPETGKARKGKPPSQGRLLVYLMLLMVLFFVLEQALEQGTGDLLDPDRLVDWLNESQDWAWLVILVLWQVQAVVAPIPGFMLTMATALLYGDSLTGALFAILLTWTGAMLGAIICFGLSRRLGRDWVVRKGYLDRMEDLDLYLEEKGAFVIFLTRLIPILSFDIVSYAAGLTRIKWRDFAISTGVGMVPATVLLVLFAYFTMNQERSYFYVICVLGLILLAVASYLLVWLMNDYREWGEKQNGGEGSKGGKGSEGIEGIEGNQARTGGQDEDDPDEGDHMDVDGID